MLKSIWIGALVIFVAVLSGVADQASIPSPSLPVANFIEVTLSEWGLALSTTTFPTGTVRFVVENVGTMGHSLRITGEGFTKETEVLGPGQSQSFEVELNPGTYELLCPLFDHSQLGMEAILMVVEPSPPTWPPGIIPLQDFDVNQNDLIDDEEFLAIIDAWIGEQVSDSTLFQAIELWVLQKPIPQAARRPGSLKLSSVNFTANTVRSAITFVARGQEIGSMNVEIFDMAGMKIFSSEVAGKQLAWSLNNQEGERIANGVYLARVTARGFNGEVIRGELRKLLVLR